jgi:hypothetical protein
MKKGLHYEDTYSPLVSWQNIRLFLILAAINGWHTTQIDFVMAYTQADIATITYMELPPRVNLPNLSKIHTASASSRISMVARTQEEHGSRILENT